MTPLIAIGLLAASVPHRFVLRRSSPAAAAAICLAGLLLRGLIAALLATFVLLYLPATQTFAAFAGWCWHSILPVLPVHLSLNGHTLGDAATVFPIVALTASAASAAWAVMMAARTTQRVLKRRSLGPGPRDTILVGGAEVVVATAGLTRPRIILSAGALAHLDDEELAASVAHERGHVVRSHRFVLLVAQLACACASLLPGTNRIYSELRFQLERDADAYALARRHDGLALASAICKAADSRPRTGVALTLSGGGQLERRIRELVDRPAHHVSRAGSLMAGALLATVVALTFSISIAAAGSPVLDGKTLPALPCPA